jgi:hypothetical protein
MICDDMLGIRDQAHKKARGDAANTVASGTGAEEVGGGVYIHAYIHMSYPACKEGGCCSR